MEGYSYLLTALYGFCYRHFHNKRLRLKKEHFRNDRNEEQARATATTEIEKKRILLVDYHPILRQS